MQASTHACMHAWIEHHAEIDIVTLYSRIYPKARVELIGPRSHCKGRSSETPDRLALRTEDAWKEKHYTNR